MKAESPGVMWSSADDSRLRASIFQRRPWPAIHSPQSVGQGSSQVPTGSLYPMDYLYSPYEALVSIHVPNDKARAVVDAMERDMGTTIATKADLQLLRQEMATKVDFAGLRQEFALLRRDLESQSTGFHKDLELLSTTMTVRLRSMLVVGFGVMIPVLKFLQS
jgi:hypothetical protein